MIQSCTFDTSQSVYLQKYNFPSLNAETSNFTSVGIGLAGYVLAATPGGVRVPTSSSMARISPRRV